MYARIGRWHGDSQELRRWAERSRNEVLPQVEATPGSRGVLLLLDREQQQALTITLWESENALRESEQRRAAIQAGTTEASGAQVETSRYEVIDMFIR